MSLFSILSGTSQSSDIWTSTLQKISALKGENAAAAATTTSAASGLVITTAAKIAAAAEADAKKDAATLVADTRKALDTKGKLSDMSPRALATVVLNSDGTFSKAEAAAAKQELKSRDKAEILAVIAKGLTADNLTTYQNQRYAAKSTMSAEERLVRTNGL